MGDRRSAYRVIVGVTWGKETNLEDPGVDGENIKMDRQEVGWGGMDWIDLAQDRDWWQAFMNAVMKFRDPPPQKKTEFPDWVRTC